VTALRSFVVLLLKARAFLGADVLKALAGAAAATPELIEKAWPLPAKGEVAVYLAGLGVHLEPPASQVVLPVWEAALADQVAAIYAADPVAFESALEAYAADPVGAEAQLRGLVEAWAAEEGYGVDPATIALIIELITVYGPKLLELIRKRRQDRNPKPEPAL